MRSARQGRHMVYITGDTHGNQVKWDEQIHGFLKSGDTIVVTGDFGVGFWGEKDRSEQMFYDFLAQQPYTVLFCDGNHENFDKLNAYPVVPYCGGRVHGIRSNVMHLMRGEVYQIEGKSVFVFGGGYSLDQYRRRQGYDWWQEEMPDDAEYRNASERLRQHGNRVDCVITHTAPAETVFAMSTMRELSIRAAAEERPLTTFLEYLRATVTYTHWYFGHFHIDRELWRNQTAVFDAIREMESGKLAKQWPPYEGG